MNANEMFEKLTQEMMDKFLEKNPDFATFLGLHDPYDYLLPNGSTENLLQNLHLIEEWAKRLNETADRRELSEEHRVEWDVIQTAKEQGKFAFYEQRKHELDPNAFDDLGQLLFVMLTRDYAPLEKRLDAIAARTEKLPKYLDEFRSRFKDSKPVKLWTQIAIEVAQNMAGMFQFILHAAKDNVSDRVYERLNKAVLNLQPALETHLEWLQTLLPKTTEQWALGRQRFEKLLQLRGLGMSSDEIYDLGVRYLAELKAQRAQLARQIAPAKSFEEVLQMIEAKSPKTFEEALEFTAKCMEEARRFVQEKNLATVFPEDVLLVKETPSLLAPVTPFAALMMPAKFDKPQIGIYIVTRPKDTSNLGKHLNYASVRNTAVHEAFPGHFLQGAVSNRGSIVHLLANGIETVEGWAHYCEQMMSEKGFIADPEARLMQVNDMIWRAVRIMVDVKLARGEMSFEEAVTMLVRETGMSREGAEAEVKRYTQTPGYALSYLLGKHLLLKLKEESKRSLGERFDEKVFHDTITANGYLPICLLQKIFDQKTREFKSS